MIAVRKPTRFWLPLIAMITLALSTLPTASAAKEQPNQKHCVIQLEPAKDNQPSPMKEGPCFATIAESVAAATNGRVQLPSAATPDDIDRALKTPHAAEDAGTASSYVLSIEFLHRDFQGSTYTFTGYAPCSPDLSYYVDTIYSSWNDEISSSRGYSNCNIVGHWEHSYRNAYRSGTLFDCYYSCSYLGSMNDRTSSLDWLYY